MTITSYDRDALKSAVRNPSLVVTEVERILKKPLHVPRRTLFRLRHDGADVMDEDWDNLVILDACRFDKFQRVNPFDGDAEPITVRSSQSAEFCEAYLSGREFHDTVYVTANPYGARVESGTFHDTVVTFDDADVTSDEKAEVTDVGQSWAPDLVRETALDVHESHPEKRLVVHFMQPHAPYYGRRAAEIRSELREDGLRFWAWDGEIDRTDRNEREEVVSHLLSAAQEGYVTPDQLEAVYLDNLEIVLEHVRRLLDEVDGKTAITSDHGEMLGERKLSLPRKKGHLTNYIGHERGVYLEELREVPWLTVESGRRRDVTADPPVEDDGSGELDTDEQLKALGYAE